MKHEHVFTQTDQTHTPEGSRTISKLFPQNINIKLGWKALCTLLCTIALILLLLLFATARSVVKSVKVPVVEVV